LQQNISLVLVPKIETDWAFDVYLEGGIQVGEVDAQAEWYIEPNHDDRMLVLEHRLCQMFPLTRNICWYIIV